MTLLEAISPTARELLALGPLESKLQLDGGAPREGTRPTGLKALSIRQPWAWLITHGHKDVENRDWPTKFRGEFLVHASSRMTKADYEACVIFIAGIPRSWRLPAYDVLRKECGGIVGSARVMDCVDRADSPWFTGEYGFLLSDAKELPFRPCSGNLGFFEVTL